MIGLTKKEEKLILSLHQRKFRKQEDLFLVEGIKMVEEALASNFKIKYVVSSIEYSNSEVVIKSCDERTMKRISNFTTPPGLLAVVEIPQNIQSDFSGITLVVEKIQDPGNFGTIIRTAEAFGVKTILCSDETVDHFSSKVVQSTMGSIFRLPIQRINFQSDLSKLLSDYPFYAAHLEGDNLYKHELTVPCFLAVGNESKGISAELIQWITNSLYIPMKGKAESFNVSIATAIILSEFNRRGF